MSSNEFVIFYKQYPAVKAYLDRLMQVLTYYISILGSPFETAPTTNTIGLLDAWAYIYSLGLTSGAFSDVPTLSASLGRWSVIGFFIILINVSLLSTALTRS